MREIRRHLLGWLMPGFILLWAGAGVSIFAFARQGAESRMEADLREIASAFPAGGFPESDGIQEFADYFSEDRGIYFQLWLPQGTSLLKSRTLGAFELTPPETFSREGRFGRQALGSGDEVATFAVQSRENGALGRVNLLVAKSREELNAELLQVVISILVGGAIGAFAFVGLLGIALRSGFKPLTTLGERAAGIDARSLHERFPIEKSPKELRPIVAALNGLMERLEESFQREKRFSSDLAHELRNPVAALKSTAEVALKWPEEARVSDYEDIKVIAEELQETIENILFLVNLESAEANDRRSPVRIRQLVEESWLLSSEVAQARGVSLDMQVAGEETWKTDPRLFRIIVNNLLSNAAEYAPEGSEIVVRSDGTGGMEFENPAPSLKEEDLPKLFDRLWRHDSSRTGSGHSGLGLALARACSEALDLELKASLGGGGELRFRLERNFGEVSS